MKKDAVTGTESLPNGTIFSRNLKKQRILKSVTQKVMAEQLYVDASSYGKWEKGIREPGTEMIIRIAEVLGINPGVLFEKEK